MKKFFSEFKTFAMRGNVVDMAVGVILGAAFGKVVSALVANIIMPPLGFLIGGINFTELSLTIKEAGINPLTGNPMPGVILPYGAFIQTVFDFLIITFAIFLMIKGMNKVMHKDAEETPPPPPSTEEALLLKEIRDFLKKES